MDNIYIPDLPLTNLIVLMEPTTVGSLWLENDLHENEFEFESHMGRSKKFVRVISDEIHGNPRDLNMYRTGRPLRCFVSWP